MLGKCHVEACNGSPEQNKKYCEKDGIVTELGDPPSQGARCDLKALFEEMEQGKTNEEILDDTPQLMHQYGRVIDQKRAVMNRKIVRSWHTTCEWAYGPTGTGKTYHWKSIWDAEKMWVYKLNDRGWCDGYRGQPIVIINELRPGDIPYRELLNMIDDIPHWIPNRANEPIPFMAKHIYITSPFRPEDVYCDLSGADKIEQLTDRIAIRHFTGPSKRKTCKNIFLHDVSKELDGLCEEETDKAGGSEAGTSQQHEDGQAY